MDPSLSFKSHYNHVLDKTSNKLNYLYGIKRYITTNTMKVMLNADVHSVSDYCLDIWAIQTDNMLTKIQDKVDRFIINYNIPVIAKKMKRGN